MPHANTTRTLPRYVATGERALFGSRGGGPGEYERVSWAFKVHSDSVAIVGAVAGSPFPVISAATGIGRTTRVSLSSDSALQTVSITERPTIRSADTLGYLYANSRTYSMGEDDALWPQILLAAQQLDHTRRRTDGAGRRRRLSA